MKCKTKLGYNEDSFYVQIDIQDDNLGIIKNLEKNIDNVKTKLLQNSVVNLPAKDENGHEIIGKTQLVNKSYLCVECNISNATKRVNYMKLIEKTKNYYY